MSWNQLEQELDRSGKEPDESNFSVVKHRILGTMNTVSPNVIYSTTFLGIAQYAFLQYFHQSSLEICNVSFLAPLVINADGLEAHIVVKKEADSLWFIVSSQSSPSRKELDQTSVKFCEGIMYKISANTLPKYRWAEIKKRCAQSQRKTGGPDIIVKTNRASKVMKIGHVFTGPDEILAEVKIAKHFMDESKGKVLHPSLCDWIINIAIQCIEPGVFQPLFYKSLKLYGEMPSSFSIYLTKKDSDPSSGSIAFNIFFIDEFEQIFLAVEDYTVRYQREKLPNLPVSQKTENTAKIRVESNNTKIKEDPDNQRTNQADISQYISNLSWRQMDCFDRCTALLVGGVQNELVNYFKLFLGAHYGYSIDEFIAANDASWNSENEIILDMFGIKRKIIAIGNIAKLHAIIMESIDTYGNVITRFDEYYMFYSPHYFNGHTNHMVVINGYDKKKQRYSIIDHNHILKNNGSEKINFSNFFAPFDIIKNSYRNRRKEDRYCITLDKADHNPFITAAELNQKLIKLLHYLKQSSQSGNDVQIIRDILEKKKEFFDTGNINALYRILGGKELFIETILDYIGMKNTDMGYLSELSKKVISLSNHLINSYLVALYRKRELQPESTIQLMNEIQNYSTQFYHAMLHVLDVF
jgi:hypothetical protein